MTAILCSRDLCSQDISRFEFGLGFQTHRYRIVAREGDVRSNKLGGSGFILGARFNMPAGKNFSISLGCLLNNYRGGYYTEFKRFDTVTYWESVELSKTVLSIPIMLNKAFFNKKLEVGLGIQLDRLLANRFLMRRVKWDFDTAFIKVHEIHNSPPKEYLHNWAVGPVLSIAYHADLGPVTLIPRYSFYMAITPDTRSYADFNSMRNMFELSIKLPLVRED